MLLVVRDAEGGGERKAKMMAINDIKIKIETERIVKMYCKNRECKHNLANKFFRVGAYCNLKHIQLDEIGVCEMLVREKGEDDA